MAGKSTAKRLGLIIPDGFKCCSRGLSCIHPMGCIQPQTPDYFYRNSKKSDGFHPQCKACADFNTSRWVKNNPDRRHAIDASWRENNPERKKEHEQRYASNNRQKERERSRKKRKEHPENPVIKAISMQRHRARKRSLPATFTKEDWQRTLDYFNGCCAVCERPLRDLFATHTIGADHWIPIVSPECPGTVKENMICLCHGADGCNNSKGGKNAEQWLIECFGKRKGALILERINAYFEWVKQF